MNNAKEVWKLFKTDPICRTIFRFYEKVKFPVYAILTFTYLFVIPLLLDFILYKKIPNFKSQYFMKFFLIYGIIPIIGSYLGHRWLSSVLSSFRELVDKQILKKAPCKSARENLFRYCNKRVFIFLAFFFLCCVIFKMYLQKYATSFSDNVISDVYLFLVTSVWWYIIIKVFLVCLIIFHNYKNLLLTKSSGRYVLKISLYHPDTYYGLASIGKLCINFLLLYIIVLGSYLTLSIWYGSSYKFLDKLLSPFMLSVLTAYIALPAYGFFAVIWTAHKRIEEARHEELNRIWQKIGSKEDVAKKETSALINLHGRIKRYTTWPVRIREGISLFYVYLVPVISWCIKVGKLIIKN